MSGLALDFYDRELVRYRERFRAAVRVGPEDRVLDVGCGTGQSGREAAAAGRSVLGVDLSPVMVGRARELAEGLTNLEVVQADAQTHPFPAASFDLVISQFGVMFFADPPAAFGNLARALRPGGRLALLVWQAEARNEWAVALRTALGGGAEAGGPFSLADPIANAALLRAAGFADITHVALREPIHYGPDVDGALAGVRGLRSVGTALAAMTPEQAAAALGRLRGVLAAHEREDGVWFDSRAWLVTAVRLADVESGPTEVC